MRALRWAISCRSCALTLRSGQSATPICSKLWRNPWKLVVAVSFGAWCGLLGAPSTFPGNLRTSIILVGIPQGCYGIGMVTGARTVMRS